MRETVEGYAALAGDSVLSRLSWGHIRVKDAERFGEQAS
jgi:hypothetical protein